MIPIKKRVKIPSKHFDVSHDEFWGTVCYVNSDYLTELGFCDKIKVVAEIETLYKVLAKQNVSRETLDAVRECRKIVEGNNGKEQ